MPLTRTFLYSFNNVTIGKDGLEMEYLGLGNYQFMLFKDPFFVQNIADSIRRLVQDSPVIIFYSLFFAILLNRRFRGRTLVRILFFLPVVLTSGVVFEILGTEIFYNSNNSSIDGPSFMQGQALRTLLYESRLPANLVAALITFVDRIFSLTWRSGVQIILFLAGLQSIPPMYYEAAHVEGASGWATFLKITLPMMSPITFMVLIYTIIDNFTDYSNRVLRGIFSTAINQLQYGLSSAQASLYFMVVIVFILAANLMFRRGIQEGI